MHDAKIYSDKSGFTTTLWGWCTFFGFLRYVQVGTKLTEINFQIKCAYNNFTVSSDSEPFPKKQTLYEKFIIPPYYQNIEYQSQ